MPKKNNLNKQIKITVQQVALLAKKWGAKFSSKELKDIKNYKEGDRI